MFQLKHRFFYTFALRNLKFLFEVILLFSIEFLIKVLKLIFFFKLLEINSISYFLNSIFANFSKIIRK
jgi:hypothetical protein